MPRTLRLLFVAFVAATLGHIAYIMLREPFAFDAWNLATDTHAEPFSFGNFLHYWAFEYTHSNPRIGQPLTYLAYKLVWFAPIVTPLVFLAIAKAVTALGTGRIPSWSRGRDLALVTIALGFAWFALPHIGMVMFCRAYGANYVYGAAIQLWFLVPLRVSANRPTDASVPACIAYGVLGMLAGACNEHTGPTLCLFAIAYAGWRHRQGAPSLLARVGALGAAVGFALIFFAPGQGERYDGLAQKQSLLGHLLSRGVLGNFDIFRDLVIAAAPLLALFVLVLAFGSGDSLIDEARIARRNAMRLVVLVIAAGVLVTMTLFVSPKLGPRFYIMPMALLLAGFLGVADVVLASPRRLAPFVILAVLASTYAAARTLPMYTRLDLASDERLEQLEASPHGGVVTIDGWEQVEDSWWFLGDDFRDPKKRQMVATYFDLQGIIFRGTALDAPLGITDVTLVPRYEITPASCVDQYGGLDLGPVRPLDIAALHKAMEDGVATLRGRLPAGAELHRLDLEVELQGTHAPWPQPHLYIGKWKPAGLAGWVGTFERHGRGTVRSVVLPPELKTMPGVDIWIYLAGGEARRLGTANDAELAYTPWKTGVYWALACQPDECFVIAAARQGG